MSTSSWLSSRSHLDSRWRLWAWQPASTPSTTWGMTMINCLDDLAGTTIVGHAEKKRVRKEGMHRKQDAAARQVLRFPCAIRHALRLKRYTLHHIKKTPPLVPHLPSMRHKRGNSIIPADSITPAVSLFLRVPSLLQSTAAVLDGCRNLLGLLGSLKKTYQFKAKIQRISQAPASGDIAVSDNALACVGYPGKLLLKSRITGGCPAL